MTNEDLIRIGFKKIPTLTIVDGVICDLGRDRQLLVGYVGTPNETVWITQSKDDDYTIITDMVCLHNYDYDGYLTETKIKTIIMAITGKMDFAPAEPTQIDDNSEHLLVNNTIDCASLKLGIYDSENGESIIAYKIADATILCRNSKRCVIKYANIASGKLAQICNWYNPNEDLGTTLHYYISEMSFIQLVKHETFAIICRCMAVDPFILAQFIYENQ